MEATKYPTKAEIERAAQTLRSGGLVAFPTETVYGLGANALDPAAVRKIYAAKGRPSTSPLIVHAASVEMARSVVAEWPEQAARLAARFWPGPLTLVLPKMHFVPDEVTAGLQTVGVRVPAHALALELIQAAGVPLAAPSANRFTHVSPTEAEHVRRDLGNAVEIVLDAGPTQIGIESTVVSLVGGRAELLRPGMITQPQIEEQIGPVGVHHPGQGSHSSPGLHPKHYSPATKLIITKDLPPGRGAYLWWRREAPAAVGVRMPEDPALYARDLYSTLHRLDLENLEYIAVEPLPESTEWAGIWDRLRRASK
jgi:L-threonylcarbamoyladenylate synthase